MKKLSLLSLTGALLLSGSANAFVIWTENFSGFTAGTDYRQGVARYAVGFADEAGIPPIRQLDFGQWGKTGGAASAFGFNDIGGGNIALQPNRLSTEGGTNDMKGAGVFLASSLFTQGSGVYQLQYDLIADGAGLNQNARIWIGTSSTHDQTAANGWVMRVDQVNPNTPALPWELTGTATVNTTFSENLDTSSSFTGILNFNYTEGEDVALVFGSVNSSVAFDNLNISFIPESSSFAFLAGLLGLGLVSARRRR
ncbi:MAG: hypothetical protein ACNA77_06395 [Opitutales bacterium]